MNRRRIVLDANILIRAVLGKRVRELITQYASETIFLAPEAVFAEAGTHLPTIALKRNHNPQIFLQSLEALENIVEIVTEETYGGYYAPALARIGGRDPMDWPIVATALALSCPIWTEDRDFFGAGIATWTSANIEIYLSGN